MKRHIQVAVAIVSALSLTARVFAAELFLIPDKPVISMQSEPLMRLVGETFLRNQPAIPSANRLDVSVAGNGRVTRLREWAWYEEAECTVTSVSTVCGTNDGRAVKRDAVSILKYQVAAPGTYVVDVSTRPQVVSIQADQFQLHLQQAGALDMMQATQNQEASRQIRERDSGRARAIVQVSDTKTSDFARVSGHSLEVILEQNPYERSVGDTIAFKVFHDKKPLANQLVRVGYQGVSRPDAPSPRVNVYELRTDSGGRAGCLLTTQALWFVSAVQVRKSGDAQADYDTTWATVTFRIK